MSIGGQASLIAVLSLAGILTGCRSLPERPADGYVLTGISFRDDKSATAAVRAECPIVQVLEASLIGNAAKRSIAVHMPPTEAAAVPLQNTLTVTIEEVVGGRFGNIMGPRWVVSEIFATLSVKDAKGPREREIVCRAGLGMNPLGNLTACDRLGRCAESLGLLMVNWLQRTR